MSRTGLTTIGASTEFLYTGPDPIQTGVSPGTISPVRVAVFRGRVLDESNAPLPSVRITVLDHPELGQTISRADGRFDLVVNGGETLTITYERGGFLPVQRHVEAPWQEFVNVEDVVMKPYDTKSTAIDLDAGSLQVAEATSISDGDGTRQAVLMFEPGTDAVMELPDGSTRSLGDGMVVRATEYTVGAGGDEAMPGELPSSSGYTYAVELSVDEAAVAGATEVRFDKPVANYVDNFLGFPAGTPVPTASYDRERAAWVPAEDGIVIKIVGESGGLALVDVDGDAAADSDEDVARLGIDAAERAKLAMLYDPGKSLWRVQVSHFTPWDHNWPYGLEDDAQDPRNPEDEKPPCPDCNGPGSVIGFLNQTLGEEIRLRGTPFSLHYSSGGSPGYEEAYTLDVPVTGATIPPTLLGIVVRVTVAGRIFSRSVVPAPNHTEIFEWDGKDAYGRTVQGAQPATVEIGYVYRAVYMEPERARRSFARFGNRPISADRARREITLWQTWQRPLGTLTNTPEQGLGGWTLSVHHAYDPNGRTLALGTGERWTTEAIKQEIRAAAGGGFLVGDGVPVGDADLRQARGMAVGPDGTLYVADTEGGRVRHVRPDGTIETVAGGGNPEDGVGDGLPATQAALLSPSDVDIAADGTIVIADTGNGRIRRVGPDGIIRTVAGGGIPGELGDDGPATSAWLNRPRGIAVAADGTLFVADTFNDRVRRVTPDGGISTAAGGGSPPVGVGDGGLATDASLRLPYDVAVDPDGQLLIADGGHYRVRAVRSDGRIETIAGTGRYGYSGDGGPATEADIGEPVGLEAGRDGAIYLADRAHHVVRRVDAQGFMTTFAGTGDAGDEGDLGPPARAELGLPQDVAVGPDGTAYVVDGASGRVRGASPGLPGFDAADLQVPSQDGRELYLFTADGRHLRTLDALTGTLLYRFEYDAAGRLTKAIDADGDTTEILHDGQGKPTKVVASGGQETVLTVDGDGYLATAGNPLTGQIFQLETSASGLLSSFTKPGGGVTQFFYDDRGRLIRDEDAANGFTALSRDESGPTTVTVTTALGRTTRYVSTRLPDGSIRRDVIDPSGARSESVTGPDGTSDAIAADGTTLHVETGPDPRWGMGAPIATKIVRTLPSGRTETVTHERSVTLSDPADPFALQTLVDTSTTNGRLGRVSYNGSTRTATTTTPGGRQFTEVFDARGRVVSRKIAPSAAPILYQYDEHGRPKSFSQGPESETFTYDARNRLVTRTDGIGRETHYAYDDADRVSQLRLPSGRTYGFAYDANGNRTSITMPSGAVHALGYSALDQPASYAPPANPAYTWAYDDDRAETAIGLPSGRSTQRSFDGGGRVTGFQNRAGATVESSTGFAYGDATPRVTRSERSFASGPSQETVLGYDGQLVTSRALAGAASGAFTYTYDQNSFLTGIKLVSGADTVDTPFSRDEDGFATQVGPFQLERGGPGGAESAITDTALDLQVTYDSLTRIASRSHTVGGTERYRVAVERDGVGRISRRVETVDGVPATLDYTYDLDGRLTQVARGDGTILERYAYDPNGNRTSRRLGDGPAESATYDAQDRLTALGGVAYEFDADGFLAERGTDTFRYSAQGELLEAAVGGQTVGYAYDAVGRRVARTQGAARHEYFYGHPWRQFLVTAARAPSGQLTTFYYDDRGFLFALERGGNRFYVATDQVGSPRVVANAAGTVVKRIAYNSFGNVLEDTNPAFDLPFSFAGGLRDELTGFVRFGFRDYDPAAGRWTARDPIFFAGGDANLYAYGGNDPVGMRDLTGLVEWPTWGQVQQFGGRVWDAVNSLEIKNKVLDLSRSLKDKFDKVTKGTDVVEEATDLAIQGLEAESRESLAEEGAGWAGCFLKLFDKIPIKLTPAVLLEMSLEQGAEHYRTQRDTGSINPTELTADLRSQADARN